MTPSEAITTRRVLWATARSRPACFRPRRKRIVARGSLDPSSERVAAPPCYSRLHDTEVPSRERSSLGLIAAMPR